MSNRISKRMAGQLKRIKPPGQALAASNKVNPTLGQRAGLTLAGGAVGVLSIVGAASNAAAGSASIQNTAAPPSNSLSGHDRYEGFGVGWNGGSTVVIEQNPSSAPSSVSIVPQQDVIPAREMTTSEVQPSTSHPSQSETAETPEPREAAPPVVSAPAEATEPSAPAVPSAAAEPSPGPPPVVAAEPAPVSEPSAAPVPAPVSESAPLAVVEAAPEAQPLVKPAVTWVPSPNFDERPDGRDIDAIVLHHTASNNTEGDLAYFASAEAGVSPHYLIGTDGTIFQLVEDQKRAFHAGVSELDGEPSVNNRSIGIEITNDGSGQTPFTEEQYKALEQLVPWLVQEYDIPMDNVVGHKEVAPERKIDPAENFDNARIDQAISDKVPA